MEVPETEPERDALTGLPGPQALADRLADWRKHGGIGVHALMLSLRRFDAVNLAYGRAAGDLALAELAHRIGHFASSELDGPYVIARVGGGSFVLLAKEKVSRERWRLFADQLADAVSRPLAIPAGVLHPSPRLALLRALEGESAASILDRLSQTIEAAGRYSGRRLAWADGEATRAGRSAAQLEADLLKAIDRGEIEVVFQPQFALPEDKLSGAEALARWNHPRLGRIGAGALFTIAERAEHVAPLFRHIAARALDQARGWRAGLRLSLNVTATDLAEGNFAQGLLAQVAQSGFPASSLTLEVTEQALVQDVQQAAGVLARLCESGMRVALDDFGAGFCNFRYLKLLPLHYLKLDRSMVDRITTDPRDLAVLRAIIAMAGALDLQVIAEGIESESQRSVIASEGCAFYQGFIRAHPMSAAEFLKL